MKFANCLYVLQFSSVDSRAFSVAGPMAWNALPDDLRHRSLSADNFRKGLKNVSECTWTLGALEALRNALYKFKTYLLYFQLYLFVQNCVCKLAHTQRLQTSAKSVHDSRGAMILPSPPTVDDSTRTVRRQRENASPRSYFQPCGLLQ